MIAVLGLLKNHQARLVDKLSELVLASSSSGEDPFDSVSSLSDNGKTFFWTKTTWNIIKTSEDRVDKNLLHLFLYKKQSVQDLS